MDLKPHAVKEGPSCSWPFNRVYNNVEPRMWAAAAKAEFSKDEGDWLRRLVLDFRSEWRRWREPGLQAYCAHWSRYHTNLARLVAGAFLHISYDLPRVLANNWPRVAPHANLTELDGYYVFADVKDIFPESFSSAVRNYGAVGFWIVLTAPTSAKLRAVFEQWLLYLRQAAWEHGRILASEGNRPAREAAMLDAVTGALKDVSDLRPWSYARLAPPDNKLRSAGLAAAGASLPWLGPVAATAAIAAAAGSVATFLYLKRREERRSDLAFIGAFGETLADYVAVAVCRPETFAEHRANRRRDMGLPPEEAGEAAVVR